MNFISVFEIILKVSEGQPWKETFLEVLPQRKFVPRNRRNRTVNSQDQSEDESSDGDTEEKPNLDEKSSDESRT